MIHTLGTGAHFAASRSGSQDRSIGRVFVVGSWSDHAGERGSSPAGDCRAPAASGPCWTTTSRAPHVRSLEIVAVAEAVNIGGLSGGGWLPGWVPAPLSRSTATPRRLVGRRGPHPSDRIHQLGDVIHNLSGGVLNGLVGGVLRGRERGLGCS